MKDTKFIVAGPTTGKSTAAVMRPDLVVDYEDWHRKRLGYATYYEAGAQGNPPKLSKEEKVELVTGLIRTTDRPFVVSSSWGSPLGGLASFAVFRSVDDTLQVDAERMKRYGKGPNWDRSVVEGWNFDRQVSTLTALGVPVRLLGPGEFLLDEILRFMLEGARSNA